MRLLDYLATKSRIKEEPMGSRNGAPFYWSRNDPSRTEEASHELRAVCLGGLEVDWTSPPTPIQTDMANTLQAPRLDGSSSRASEGSLSRSSPAPMWCGCFGEIPISRS